MSESESRPSSRARRALIAGAAVAATGLGAWVALRRGDAGPDTVTAGGAEAALWTQSFDAPSGSPVVMSGMRGKPLLINFWATWCAPCVREMPQIDRFYRDHTAKGWQVLGLAIDGPTPVREFLAKRPVTFAIGLAGLEGTELARSLGNERGGLPFSVAFDRQGRLAHRKLGETSYEELSQWAAQMA